MKKPMLAALILSSVVLLAGCDKATVEEETVVENNEPEIEVIVDEEPEVEVVVTDEETIDEDVLAGAEEVEGVEAPEVEETTEETAEEAAE